MKLKTKVLILFALFLTLTSLVRTSFASTWEKSFGGTEGDWGLDVGPTSDGGYIMVGESYSYGLGGDVLLVKTDAAGNKIWRKNFGGNNVDQGYSVQQTIDGGYIIVGRTKSYGNGGYDVYLIKTYENGDLNWSKTFGGSYADGAFSVRQTSDLGFIIAGYTQTESSGTSRAYLIKTDSNGNYLWSQIFGGSYSTQFKCVRESLDGGYIVSGSISINQGEIYLVKTFSDGDIDWIKTFGQTPFSVGSGHVEQTSDGGYILSGSIGLPNQDKFDYYLLKTDGSGNKAWDKTFLLKLKTYLLQ